MVVTEAKIQSDCVVLFRNEIGRHEKGVMVEVNNNEIGIVRGANRKAMGLVTGFPDTIVILHCKIFFIEFKKPGGKQSPKQKIMERILTKLGFKYYICDSVQLFKKIINHEGGYFSN